MKTALKNIPRQPGCNVSSTFNFTVGGVSIIVALLIGYLVYVYWL
jgi:hypothetical protein